jgi:hypothetical protein
MTPHEAYNARDGDVSCDCQKKLDASAQLGITADTSRPEPAGQTRRAPFGAARDHSGDKSRPEPAGPLGAAGAGADTSRPEPADQARSAPFGAARDHSRHEPTRARRPDPERAVWRS